MVSRLVDMLPTVMFLLRSIMSCWACEHKTIISYFFVVNRGGDLLLLLFILIVKGDLVTVLF